MTVHDDSSAARLVLDEVEEATADWRDLCRWDPLLPPDAEPPIAQAMVAAVGEALRQPQPLGWGPDPAVEPVAEAFAMLVGAPDTAAEELVCLHEALRRRLEGRVPAAEAAEAAFRLQMVVDRAIVVAVRRSSARLQEDAFVDVLTGLPNRRAFDRDLGRELARALRYGRILTVALLDVDGLKTVNDTGGHAAGDSLLRAVAGGLADVLRASDRAYRIGGDEFAVVLPETERADADAVLERVLIAGAPSFTWGTAALASDGDDAGELLSVADRRLYDRRSRRRSVSRLA